MGAPEHLTTMKIICLAVTICISLSQVLGEAKFGPFFSAGYDVHHLNRRHSGYGHHSYGGYGGHHRGYGGYHGGYGGHHGGGHRAYGYGHSYGFLSGLGHGYGGSYRGHHGYHG